MGKQDRGPGAAGVGGGLERRGGGTERREDVVGGGSVTPAKGRVKDGAAGSTRRDRGRQAEGRAAAAAAAILREN